MKEPIRASDADTIDKLQAEIGRLQASQKMMRDANAAVRSGDDAALQAMGFSEEHIAELKQRDLAGRTAFPDYALRNNNNSIRYLRRCMEESKTRAAPPAKFPDLEMTPARGAQAPAICGSAPLHRD